MSTDNKKPKVPTTTEVNAVSVPQFSDAHKAEIFRLQRDAAGARLRKQALLQQAEQQANAAIEATEKALNERLTTLAVEYKINSPEYQFDAVNVAVTLAPQPSTPSAAE